jgi:hypothetical protein
MQCWFGHGPWHYHGYPYPPPYPVPGHYFPPEFGPPPRWGTRRRPADADELAEYLQPLEEEIARVRRDLDELRGSGAAER